MVDYHIHFYSEGIRVNHSFLLPNGGRDYGYFCDLPIDSSIARARLRQLLSKKIGTEIIPAISQ